VHQWTQLRSENQQLRAELGPQNQQLRAELGLQNQQLRSENQQLRAELGLQNQQLLSELGAKIDALTRSIDAERNSVTALQGASDTLIQLVRRRALVGCCVRGCTSVWHALLVSRA
jgi:cell shape-determining protein MreC